MSGGKFEGIAKGEIINLPIYSPGLGSEDVKRKYKLEEVIKLASNENPLGPSPLAVEAARKELSNANIYPDGYCGKLREKLSSHIGVSPDFLFFGNGADEIIDLIFLAFFNKGDRAVMGNPTFSSYYLSGMAVGAEIVYVPLENYRHDIEGIVNAAKKGAKAIFVGNPHNPTGTIVTRVELEYALGNVPEDTLVVWDEAYGEYVEDREFPQSVSYLEDHPNLLILRTFSKIYGLAGLRTGYAIADSEIISLLERVRPPFNVNLVAQAAAAAALDDEEHLRASREMNREGRNYLHGELEKIGFEVVPSQANFILFRFDHLTSELAEKLLSNGVIVRDGASLGYPGYVRITVGTPEQNRKVVSVLGKIIQGR